VTMFNDNGVLKPQQGLAQVDRNAIVTAKINLPGQNISNAAEWTSDRAIPIDNNEVTVTIPAGGIAVVELVPRR
jgi:hypothetical protein